MFFVNCVTMKPLPYGFISVVGKAPRGHAVHISRNNSKVRPSAFQIRNMYGPRSLPGESILMTTSFCIHFFFFIAQLSVCIFIYCSVLTDSVCFRFVNSERAEAACFKLALPCWHSTL
jgi:hypothetical protein